MQIDPFLAVAACVYFFVVIALVIGYFYTNASFKDDSLVAILIMFWPFVAFFFAFEFIMGSIARLITLIIRSIRK